MTKEKWKKIKALFSEALERPENGRIEFLNRKSGDDPDLIAEVLGLIDSHREDDEFLDSPAIAHGDVASLFDGSNAADFDSGTEPSPPRFNTGMLVKDRYEIMRLLGRGGMGEVYLARDTRIKRNVALKVLHPDLVSSKENLRRFAVEAQAVSALNHPHIMTIYEFDTADDGAQFFVGESVDGQSLNRLIRANLNLEKALDIAIQVASALSAAHEAGITHRDIKPENIIVRPDGYVKVLDFGLAKLTQEKHPLASAGSEEPTALQNRTKPGVVMGTPAYMSPEQARGKPVDARTDIWSLGVIIYEMLTGRRPFSGESSADIIVSVLSSEPPPIDSYVNEVPPELDWVVSKALTKDVNGRHQTAEELRADLEKIRKNIEFDVALNRSAGGAAKTAQSAVRNVHSTADQEQATVAEAARQTRGAKDYSINPVPFWSSPAVSSLFREAQIHKVRSSIFVLVFFALISSSVYFLIVNRSGSREINSIAVLPFENLSGNPDLTFVSDGLSERLINRLAELPGLKVISRNSSFKFRGSNIDVRDVASQLGVAAVLTGSVTQVGEDLIIRFDLADAADDRQITGGQYQRKAGDIQQVQAEIAQAVSERLRLQLTESQSRRISENDTENSEAYRYYLNGLVELNGPKDVYSGALENFEQAISIDPDFAAAYVEIGWVYVSRASGNDNPQELMPKARAAIERALAIDPYLAKAHVIRAMLKEYEFDWAGAEAEYKRAIELSPNLDFARNNYAFFLSVMDRHDEALEELEQQSIRDPLNRRLALLQKGIILVQARQFDAALEAYQQAQAVETSNDVPNFALGYAYAGKGLYNEAAGFYKKQVDQVGGEAKYSQPLVYLAATYAKIPGKQNDARRILKGIESMGGYASPSLLAAAYTALGDNDKAMELLEQAYIQRDLLLRFIKTGYEYDGLRGDPRFTDLEKRIGLKQ